jgi:hypothetical protein
MWGILGPTGGEANDDWMKIITQYAITGSQ